jgi:hypothetical protein
MGDPFAVKSWTDAPDAAAPEAGAFGAVLDGATALSDRALTAVFNRKSHRLSNSAVENQSARINSMRQTSISAFTLTAQTAHSK